MSALGGVSEISNYELNSAIHSTFAKHIKSGQQPDFKNKQLVCVLYVQICIRLSKKYLLTF